MPLPVVPREKLLVVDVDVGLAGGVGGRYFSVKEVVGCSNPSRREISGSSVGRAPGCLLGELSKRRFCNRLFPGQGF